MLKGCLLACIETQAVSTQYVMGVGGFALDRVVEEVDAQLLADKGKKEETHSHSHGASEECAPLVVEVVVLAMVVGAVVVV